MTKADYINIVIAIIAITVHYVVSDDIYDEYRIYFVLFVLLSILNMFLFKHLHSKIKCIINFFLKKIDAKL